MFLFLLDLIGKFDCMSQAASRSAQTQVDGLCRVEIPVYQTQHYPVAYTDDAQSA